MNNGNKWPQQYVRAFDRVDHQRGNRVPKGVVVPSGMPGIKDVPRQLTFGAEKYALQKPLVRYVPAGEGGATGSKTVAALVYTPSSRLRVSITAAFEPDNLSAPPAAFVVNPSWTIKTMSRNPETGRETQLQQAYPASGSAILPDAYEADTAAMLLRTELIVQDTNFSTAFVAASERVNLMLIATWEPNIEMTPEELKRLYALCSISYGPPLLLQNNAA